MYYGFYEFLIILYYNILKYMNKNQKLLND